MYVVPVIKQICFKDIKLLALKYVKSELKHDPLCTGTFKEGYSDWLSQKFTDGVNAGEKKNAYSLNIFCIYASYSKNSTAHVMGQVHWQHSGQRLYIKNHSS